jgi:hypothetical protein
MALYVNADGHSRQAASMLRVTGKKEQAQKIDEQIANRPSAICLTTVSPEAYMQARAITEEASGQGKVPVLVAYNLPERDCGLYSSGGATNIKARVFAAGIGDREAVVVLKPDAIAHSLETRSGSKPAEERYRLLAEAVNPQTSASCAGLRRRGQRQLDRGPGRSGWSPACLVHRHGRRLLPERGELQDDREVDAVREGAVAAVGWQALRDRHLAQRRRTTNLFV